MILDGILQLSREHSISSLIRWKDACLHVITPRRTSLSSPGHRLSAVFQSISAQMSQIEKALGGKSLMGARLHAT